MNHAFYLSKMPEALKSHIEAEAVYAPWLRRGETLDSIWGNSAIMETVYNQLSTREKKVLHFLVTSIGSEPFDWPKLEKLTSHVMSGAEAKVGFLLLLKKGLIYMFKKTWGEHVYVLAEDALAIWQQLILTADNKQALTRTTDTPIECVEQYNPGLASLLFQTLVFLDQNDMKLTKNGTLHKKQLQKWLDLLTIQDERFLGCSLKYAYADVYPVKLAVIMEFLFRLRLVEQRGEQLCLQELEVKRWLLLSEREQNKQLYFIWKMVAFPGPAWLQHAVLLLERQYEDWYAADDIPQWLRVQKIAPFGNEENVAGQELLDQLEQQWIHPLLAFGWMEKGFAGADGRDVVYRWRIQPIESQADRTITEKEGFYVQPDFEVLVPPNVPFAIKWELSAFADLQKADLVSVYKLGKESLQRGLEKGLQLEELLLFLEKQSLYGIPENVRLTLEQWAKPFGKVKLSEVLLLRCEDAAVAEAVKKLPGCSDCLLEEIGGQAWIVRTDQLKPLTELLNKAGWMTGKLKLLANANPSEQREARISLVSMKPLEDGILTSNDTTAINYGPVHIADKGFLYSRHTFMYFEMEQKMPDVRDLFPDLQGIPQGWMKDYRTYHASTRREMVELAMEWKTTLQVRHNGHDHIIAPRKLQETRGTWSMTGLEQSKLQEICLFPEDWQEMRIIVPGINDKY
ncbi:MULTISPECIES: helicase-associated domain-containing protein [unclassified Paenibacillus]|uniref:helicase-associated domain-containing protein n=1 Tax=unclassified Paenibacillus TaxID=185978 RepID=UPI0036280086